MKRESVIQRDGEHGCIYIYIYMYFYPLSFGLEWFALNFCSACRWWVEWCHVCSCHAEAGKAANGSDGRWSPPPGMYKILWILGPKVMKYLEVPESWCRISPNTKELIWRKISGNYKYNKYINKLSQLKEENIPTLTFERFTSRELASIA